MKKIVLVLVAAMVLVFTGCEKKETISMPFDVADVNNIEMYRNAEPYSAEKQVITESEDIADLYSLFSGLEVSDKKTEPVVGETITSFRFNLSDDTSYEIIYCAEAVKSGRLKFPAEKLDYFTSADIGGRWDSYQYEIVPVSESELPGQSENPSDPPLEETHEWDKIPMVMVDGKLYYDTGKESTISGRCGVMDGEITSTVDGSEIPTKDNQSNFGTGFEYQYGADNTIEIFMNEKWIVFEQREGDGSKVRYGDRMVDLRVFNMVLHMDEATPHLHVDFVPVATGQSRGLSTRVSMKQALKQQGFESLGRKQTEWKAWMEREKVSLGEIAQVHDFEIISLGGGRPHMDLPEYRAAAQRLEAVQEQVAAAEQDIATLEKQKKALQGNVKLLKAVEKVKPDLEAIQPEKTLTGAVKGVTVEQVKELKAAAIRGAAAEQKVQELKEENQRLQQKIPSTKEKLKEAQERQRLENQNRKLLVQVECLEQELEQERSFSDRLLDGVSAVMDFLDRHLPEKFRPLVERARELLPVPEVQQPEQEQERGHTWGGMEL